MIDRLVPFLVVLLAAALFFGYTNPIYTGEVAALRAEIASYDSALTAARQFADKEAELIAAKNSIAPESIARLEAFLPNGVDNVQLILDLDSLATRSGMRLSNFEMDTGIPEGNPDALPLEESSATDSLTLGVSAAGTYGSLRTFLAGVEQSLRPLDLVSLTLSDSETGVYLYTMLFTIYWLR